MSEGLHELKSKREINKHLLTNIRNLPSVPMVIMEVTKLLDNPRTSAAELGKLINRDQGLAAKILTVANSPLYGLPRRVSTIEFAVVILGFDHIKNIVIALSMIEAFKSKRDRNWKRKEYWLHSLMTASAAKRIADDLGYRRSGEAFIAGLLHDLGISVIQRYYNDSFAEVCETVQSKNISYFEAEKSVIDLSHAEVGQFLVERWNLPQALGESILHHHSPSESKNHRTLAAIVHLADYMTNYFQTADFDWDNQYQLDMNVVNILNLGDENYLTKFLESYKELLKNQLESFTL